jgi:F-type H+-transporting ATPase subunit delta
MKVTSKKYAESLYQAVESKTKREVNEVIENFFQILITNNDTSKLNQIIEHFEKIWNKRQGIVEARVVSANKLSNKIVKLLNSYIAKLSGAKKVKIEERIDKNVLGGVVIKYEDKILDGSLKNRLDELKAQIIR